MINACENRKDLLFSRYLGHAKYSFPHLELDNTLRRFRICLVKGSYNIYLHCIPNKTTRLIECLLLLFFHMKVTSKKNNVFIFCCLNSRLSKMLSGE